MVHWLTDNTKNDVFVEPHTHPTAATCNFSFLGSQCRCCPLDGRLLVGLKAFLRQKSSNSEIKVVNTGSHWSHNTAWLKTWPETKGHPCQMTNENTSGKVSVQESSSCSPEAVAAFKKPSSSSCCFTCLPNATFSFLHTLVYIPKSQVNPKAKGQEKAWKVT